MWRGWQLGHCPFHSAVLALHGTQAPASPERKVRDQVCRRDGSKEWNRILWIGYERLHWLQQPRPRCKMAVTSSWRGTIPGVNGRHSLQVDQERSLAAVLSRCKIGCILITRLWVMRMARAGLKIAETGTIHMPRPAVQLLLDTSFTPYTSHCGGWLCVREKAPWRMILNTPAPNV